MKWTAVVVLVAATLGSEAIGEDDAITRGCLFAAKKQFRVETVIPKNLQSFPELSPPRVSFDAFGLPAENAPGKSAFDALAIAQGKSVEDVDGHREMGSVVCEFSSASAPLQLSKFECGAFSCYVDDARLEELQALITREGF